MDRIICATQARIHFGEVMKQAKIAPVIVERDEQHLKNLH